MAYSIPFNNICASMFFLGELGILWIILIHRNPDFWYFVLVCIIYIYIYIYIYIAHLNQNVKINTCRLRCNHQDDRKIPKLNAYQVMKFYASAFAFKTDMLDRLDIQFGRQYVVFLGEGPYVKIVGSCGIQYDLVIDAILIVAILRMSNYR